VANTAVDLEVRGPDALEAGRAFDRSNHPLYVYDLADDVVEARGLLDLVTTWLKNESPAEVAHYFVRIAGGLPTVLVAAADHEPALPTALEGATKGETASG